MITANITSVVVNDPDQSTPSASAQVTYRIGTDDADAAAIGAGSRVVTLRCEIPRAAVAALQAALVSALVVADDGGWPTQAIALPLPRKT